MFSFISKLILKTRYGKKDPSKPRAFLPWEKVQKIALIICQDSVINKSAIDKFVEDTKKFVEVFYIETKSKQASYGDWICFSKKESSLLNLPNKRAEASLKDRNYDLVINTCNGNNIFSEALLAILQAPFKCAGSPQYTEADMIVNPTEPGNVLSGLNNTVRYLKMIK